MPVFATVLFRPIMLVNNLLYVKQITTAANLNFVVSSSKISIVSPTLTGTENGTYTFDLRVTVPIL